MGSVKKPSKYTLATHETLQGFADQRDKYREALEEMIYEGCDDYDIARRVLGLKPEVEE